MSKIDSFKNGTQPERRYRDWSSSRVSLVGSVMTVSGGVAQYHYADGRVCSHPDGAMHSCEYVEARNRLIPTAQRNAALVMFHDGDPSGVKRAAAFMGEMTKLWEGRNRS